jgi:hypothetical protein
MLKLDLPNIKTVTLERDISLEKISEKLKTNKKPQYKIPKHTSIKQI